jgi:hypothetical protein
MTRAPRLRRASVRRRLGARGEAVARALEALDRDAPRDAAQARPQRALVARLSRRSVARARPDRPGRPTAGADNRLMLPCCDAPHRGCGRSAAGLCLAPAQAASASAKAAQAPKPGLSACRTRRGPSAGLRRRGGGTPSGWDVAWVRSSSTAPANCRAWPAADHAAAGRHGQELGRLPRPLRRAATHCRRRWPSGSSHARWLQRAEQRFGVPARWWWASSASRPSTAASPATSACWMHWPR